LGFFFSFQSQENKTRSKANKKIQQQQKKKERKREKEKEKGSRKNRFVKHSGDVLLLIPRGGSQNHDPVSDGKGTKMVDHDMMRDWKNSRIVGDIFTVEDDFV